MQLKLRQLRSVVEQTTKHEKFLDSFRKELCEALGPAIIVSKKNSEVFKAANEQLDALEFSGGLSEVRGIKLSTLLEAAQSPSALVRKISVRLLPTKYASRFLNDTSYEVKYAAAKKLPKSVVLETAKRKNDKALMEIAYVASDYEMPVAFGPAAKMSSSVEKLSDEWYNRQARRICKEYGRNLEGQWEEKAVSIFCNSYFVTSNVKLDRDKLLNAVYDCLESRDEYVLRDLGESAIVSTSKKLIHESYTQEFQAFPVLEESSNPLKSLVKGGYSSGDYVRQFETLASVMKTSSHNVIGKYQLNEGKQISLNIPKSAKVNFNDTVNEHALDLYVKHWNTQRSLNNQPFVLSWFPHPTNPSFVNFNVELK